MSSNRAGQWLQCLRRKRSHRLRRSVVFCIGLLLFSLAPAVSNAASATIAGKILDIENLLDQKLADSALIELASVAQQCRNSQFSDTSQATQLLTLGSVFESQGHPSGATSAYKLATTIIGEAARLAGLAPDTTLYNMSYKLFVDGFFRRAEVFCKESITIWEHPKHPGRVGAHTVLGSIVGQFGLPRESAKHYRRAVEISTEVNGEDHTLTAGARWGLANLHYFGGRFAEAEFVFYQCLATYTKAGEKGKQAVAAAHLNLGLIDDARGDHEAAEEHYLLALPIMEKVGSQRGVAQALQNLAQSHLYRGNLDVASSYLTRSLEIWDTTHKPGNPFLASSIINLATLKVRQGDLKSAEKLQLRTLRIVDSVFGRSHPHAARQLVHLGRILLADNRASEAEQLSLEARQIVARAYGPETTQTAACDELLRDCYRALGKHQQASEYAIHACRIRLAALRDFAPVVTEKDALISSLKMRRSLDAFLAHYFDASAYSNCHIDTVVNMILAGKGAISDAIFARASILTRMVDSTTAELREAYRVARYRQSKLFVQGPASAKDPDYRSARDSLARIVGQRETLLAQHMEPFRQRQQQHKLTCKEVARYLPQNATLVEYFRYTDPYSDGASGAGRYAAVTIRDNGTVNLVHLGDARRIDDLIHRYRSHFKIVDSTGHLPTAVMREEYADIAVALYQCLWAPIEDDVHGQELVLVSPDGPLNLVAFGTLIDDNRYLIETHAIHYLSAGRDLMRLSTPTEPGSGLLAIGDPDFDTTAGNDDGFTEGSARPGCLDLQEIVLNPLPASRIEIKQALALWQSQREEKADTLLGPEASEERFKQEASGKRVIHLATHGYSLFGGCADDPAHWDMATDTNKAMENPLLQSGLFLAGANPGRKTRQDDLELEDGVLTAAEITATDLSGTELVVLSACESGLGAIQQGEGVYGLRRAFQMAGARTVISTLWKISDEHTATMLPTIYDLTNQSLPERLRESQRKRIEHLRKIGVADHPYSWGAFVAVGDWR